MTSTNIKSKVSNLGQSLFALFKEPLFQFLTIGLALFYLNNLYENTGAAEKTLVIDNNTKFELAQQFEQQKGRAPSDPELDKLIESWVSSEVIYRQGLALGLDKHDSAIRNRVIQKTEYLLKNSVSTAEPSEQELRQWYASNTQNYLKAPGFDFEHIFFADKSDPARTAAAGSKTSLQEGKPPGQFGQKYHRFRGRNSHGLAVTYGADFVNALSQMNEGEWQLLPSTKGWHVVKLNRKITYPAVDFEQIRPHVRADWHKHQRQQQFARRVEELRSQYTVKTGGI